MMENKKKIIDRFFLTEDCDVYETMIDGSERQIQPTFVNECWEVYALHTDKGIFYAHVGLHGGKAVYYAASSQLSAGVRQYCLLGRDLAYCLVSRRPSVFEEWRIFTPVPETARLETLVPFFKDQEFMFLQVTALSFDDENKELSVYLNASQLVRSVEGKKKIYRQLDDGYELIEAQ